MADWPVKKNAAFEVQFPIYDADGDLVTGAASLDSEVSKDHGTFTDCTNEATEIATASGVYYLSLTATEMNADIVATITKTSTSGAKTAVNVMYTAARQLIDLAYPAVSGRSIDVDATGGVEITPNQNVNVNQWLTATPNALISGRIDANTQAMASGVITAAAIATDAIDADAIASDVKTELRSIVSGTSDSGSTTTMVDSARTEADTDYWKGDYILFTSGNISGECRLITAFDPATDTITFAPATTQAVATQTYEILPAAAVDVRLWLGTAPNALVSGRVPSDVQLWLGSAVNALQSGRVDAFVGAMAAAVVTAAAIATDAIDADALATDAVNEIADGLMTRASSNWEASAPVKSLGTAIMKAVHRIRDNAGTLEIYRSNGTTVHASQTITTDAGLNPIDELTGAA